MLKYIKLSLAYLCYNISILAYLSIYIIDKKKNPTVIAFCQNQNRTKLKIEFSNFYFKVNYKNNNNYFIWFIPLRL